MVLRWRNSWHGGRISDRKPVVAADEDFYLDDPALLFQKEFVAPEGAVRARLHITGLGYCEASINGRRVGAHVLAKGWTNYEKRVFCSTYDVTGLARRGLNCVGVILVKGWWNPLPLRMWGRLNLRAPAGQTALPYRPAGNRAR